MTFDTHICTCSVCGAKSEHQFLLSWSNFSEPDLDYRPSEMGRSTMSFWIQECPECGYVSPSIEDKRKITKSWLERDEYRTCEERHFKSRLAERFFKFYLISEEEGYADNGLDAALHAAWASDDASDKENADFCRKLVLPVSQWLIENTNVDDDEEFREEKKIILIRADALRRCGRFEQLTEEYKNVLFYDEDDDLLNQTIQFQLKKAKERDDGCYTFADVRNAQISTLSYDEIKNCLMQIPPDFATLEGVYITPDQANKLAFEYAEVSWSESIYSTDDIDFSYSGYLNWCNQVPDLIPDQHSTYLYEVMKFLLPFGMDPNYGEEDDWSLMEHIIHTANGYVAADTLRLLLEHGGDPNCLVGNKSVFEGLDFDVQYDTEKQINRRVYDSLVHCWMVLIAFVGITNDGKPPVDLLPEWTPHGEIPFDICKLKDHDNYGFVITRAANGGISPTIHIYDKRTYWEVARL